MISKRKFLAVDDYGMGGIWIYVLARNENEVRIKYPKLKVVKSRPAWLDAYEAAGNAITSVDIDEEPPETLKYLQG